MRKYTRIDPVDRFWRYVAKAGADECWIWHGAAGTSKRAYGRFRLGGKRDGMISAHKFSYQLHVGPVPTGAYVLHRCDVPRCVNPRHLFVGDAGDNARDCVGKGRMRGLFRGGPDARRKHGSSNHLAKLTEAVIPHIRTDTRSPRAIASDYGVSADLIKKIRSRKLWKHVA